MHFYYLLQAYTVNVTQIHTYIFTNIHTLTYIKTYIHAYIHTIIFRLLFTTHAHAWESSITSEPGETLLSCYLSYTVHICHIFPPPSIFPGPQINLGPRDSSPLIPLPSDLPPPSSPFHHSCSTELNILYS